jgi:DNA-binding transcriptional LysR family regulator
VCELSADHQRERVQATSITTLCQMVGSGLGVTLLPASALDQGSGFVASISPRRAETSPRSGEPRQRGHRTSMPLFPQPVKPWIRSSSQVWPRANSSFVSGATEG